MTETEELIEELDELIGPPPTKTRGGKGGTIPPVEHQFKPGTSGNPGGRPKSAFSGLLRQLLDTENQVFAKAFVISLFRQACKGNQFAMKIILENIQGTFGAKGELIDFERTDRPTAWPEEDFDA